MLNSSSHMKRLVQPLPIFAGFVARQLNFDVDIVVNKKDMAATNRSVSKMKMVADGEDKETEALKDKIESSLQQFPTLEYKRGWVQVKK